MHAHRAIRLISLLTLLGLACACPAAGLLGRNASPTPQPPTRTRAAPTRTPALTATPGFTPTIRVMQPGGSAQPTLPPQPTQPPPTAQPGIPPAATEALDEETGEDVLLDPVQLTGRYQEAWLACDPPMQDWREGLVFELYVNDEDDLMVREIPDAGNEYDPVAYFPGVPMDFFVYGGEAHPDRFLYYTFETLTPTRLQGWLDEDAGGRCEIIWARAP